MLVNKQDILQLIPQRPPFVLIDSLLEHQEGHYTTGYTVPMEHVMVSNGQLTAEGMIENMAQSAAAGVGYLYRKVKGQDPPLGYIGAVGKLKVHGTAGAGSRITTKVETKHKVMNAEAIEAQVFLEDTLLAQCEMKIFLDG